MYPLGEAVAVRGLPAPRPDMDEVLMRVGKGLRGTDLPLLLPTILVTALRGFPLAGILLGAVALLHRFATLR